MIRFLQPEWLWLLALLPLALLWRGRRGAVAAVQYSNVSLARQVARETRSRAGRWVWLLPILAGTLMVVGLARPQLGHGRTEVQASGIDIVLALDVSGSMQALDFKLQGQPANRIEVVKSVVAKFIQDRPNDRIGLVAFAGAPYLVSPLTLDHDWLIQNLDRIRIGLVEDGTAIGSAIATAANRLKDKEAKTKLIVLLTDGENNAGKVMPITAAEAAKALGIRIYTIGAGTNGEAPFPVKDALGRTFYRNIPVQIDEKSLEQIASMTNGRYFRATDTRSLKTIFSEIDKLEKSKVEVEKIANYRDLFPWVLMAGLACLVAEILLSQTLWRRLP